MADNPELLPAEATENENGNSGRIVYTASEFAKENLIYLQETGRLKTQNRHVGGRKRLQSFLFLLVESGFGSLEYGGKKYELSAGKCIFLNCAERYRHTSTQSGIWSFKWVHFYGNAAVAIYRDYVRRGGAPVFMASDAAGYSDLIAGIRRAASGTNGNRDMVIYRELVLLLERLIRETVPDTNALDCGSTDAKLYLLKDYLDKHCDEKISLDMLEKDFSINKYYLTRKFKQLFGTTVNNYIITARIAKAKYHLRTSTKSVEEVGELCGMTDASYFNRVFRKVEGISPGEFRKTWSRIK